MVITNVDAFFFYEHMFGEIDIILKVNLVMGIEKYGMVGQWLWLEYEAKIYLGPGPARAIAIGIASQSSENYLCTTTIINYKLY